MKKSSNIFARFFGVIIRGQTYLNLLYLLLALPLGIFYYIYLVGQFVAGIPLVFIFIGILILVAVFAAWVAFVAFERQLAIWLLRADVPSYAPETMDYKSSSGWIGGLLTNRVTWTGLLFLFLKFPFGVFSFVVLVTLLAITIAFLAAPFIYNLIPLEVWFTNEAVWQVDTMWKALILFVIGFLMIFASLHLLNVLAWIWGRMAYWMLGRESKPIEEEPISTLPVAVEPVVTEAVAVDAELQVVQTGEAVELEAAAAAGVVAAVAAADDVADETPPEDALPWDEPGDPGVLITPPPEGADGEVPTTAAPTSQDTQYIDESELPTAAPAEENSPPEWLLEEEATGGSSIDAPPESLDDTSPINVGAESEEAADTEPPVADSGEAADSNEVTE